MRSTTMTPEQTEANGRWLLPALESISASSKPLSHDAERHLVRLRFALARVGELRERLAARASLVDAGRLDVALAVLATHYRRASDFVAGITASGDGTGAVAAAPAAKAVAARVVTARTSSPLVGDDIAAADQERIAA